MPEATTTPPSLSDFASAKFGSNVLSSGKQYGMDIYGVFRHPVDTAVALTKLASGAIQMVSGAKTIGDDTEYVQALADHYKQRYGGVDNALSTAYKDPIGVLSDASVFLGGLGLVTKVGTLGKAAKTASTINRVAEAVDPLIATTRGALRAGHAVMPATMERKAMQMYRSGLNPSRERPEYEVDAAIKAGLRAEVPISGERLLGTSGVQKAEDIISGAQKREGQIYDILERRGAEVDPNAGPRNKVTELMNKHQPEAISKDTLATINERFNTFLDEKAGQVRDASGNVITAAQPIPAKRSRAIKQATDAKIEAMGGYARDPAHSVEVATLGAISDGIRHDLYGLFPELKDLGLTQGHMILLKKEIKNFLERNANKPMVQSTPYYLGQMMNNPASAAGGLGFWKMFVDQSAYTKSLLAIALNRKTSPPSVRRTLLNALATNERNRQSAEGQIAEPPQTLPRLGTVHKPRTAEQMGPFE